MRVVTVGNAFPPVGLGGYERVWAAWVAHARAAGHDVVVLAPATAKRGQTPFGGGDAPHVHRVLRSYLRDDGTFDRPGPLATRALERHNQTALAEHLPGAGLVMWWGMGGLSLALTADPACPQMAVVHDDGWPTYGPRVDAWTARWGRFAQRRWAPQRVGHWSVNSAWSRDRLLRGLPQLDPRRVSVEHPGVDPGRFPPAAPRGAWRGRLAVVGRVEPRKGTADAIAALGPDEQLTVHGPVDPAHRSELERGASHRQKGSDPFGGAVVLAGAADDPAAAYAAADAVLFPVVWDEPWGLVPLEAMAVGRPVVASGTGGSAEYLRDGENCLLAAPGEPAAIRAALDRLARDPALRERLVAGGRTTAARFTEAGWAQAVLERAEALAGAASARPGVN